MGNSVGFNISLLMISSRDTMEGVMCRWKM